MSVLTIIYVASVIGSILSIRYDDNLFSSKPWTVFLVFCPGANTGLVILELFVLLGCIFDIIACCNLDEKFYKLIRLGRKK